MHTHTRCHGNTDTSAHPHTEIQTCRLNCKSYRRGELLLIHSDFCITVCVHVVHLLWMCLHARVSLGSSPDRRERKGVSFSAGGGSGRCASQPRARTHARTHASTHTLRQWPRCCRCLQAGLTTGCPHRHSQGALQKGRADERRGRQEEELQGRAERGQADKVETERETRKRGLIMIDGGRRREKDKENEVLGEP